LKKSAYGAIEGFILLESVALPDASTVLPDASVVLPDASVEENGDIDGNKFPNSPLPDASTVLPDASTVLPDASTVLPDASTVLPDASVEENNEKGSNFDNDDDDGENKSFILVVPFKNDVNIQYFKNVK
jgi:hypothetical protein